MPDRSQVPRVVPGFEHRPGQHCGSTAMADALRTVGVDLSEPMALGLGSGPNFLRFEGPGLSPTSFFLGRSVTYEQDLCQRLGVTFTERAVGSFGAAWKEIRELINSGRPVLALTDLRYLPYYQSSTHFNGHRIVVGGYHDARPAALVADSHFQGLMEVPLPDFERALESDAPPVTTTDCMFGWLEPPAQPVNLAGMIPSAIHAAAEAMLEDSTFMGLGGIKRLASGLRRWTEAADWKWRARFGYQVIEKRGCGGGLFRRMYADFLRESAGRLHADRFNRLADLATSAADAWTRLALKLRNVSDGAQPLFEEAAELATEVHEAERTLWEAARDLCA